MYKSSILLEQYRKFLQKILIKLYFTSYKKTASILILDFY